MVQSLFCTTVQAITLIDTSFMNNIPDFSDTELQTIQSATEQRWNKEAVELHLADVEMSLNPDDQSLTSCPAVFWQVSDCNFVVIKSGECRYRCQFFYNNNIEPLGTGIKEFDELEQCVITLLRVQADHESIRSGAYPEPK
jgi:hypothetical protein